VCVCVCVCVCVGCVCVCVGVCVCFSNKSTCIYSVFVLFVPFFCVVYFTYIYPLTHLFNSASYVFS